MSERRLITPENIPLVVAVAAVTALASFTFAIYVHDELKAVTLGAVALDVKAVKRDVELERRIKALDARLRQLEAADAAPPAEVASIVAPE